MSRGPRFTGPTSPRSTPWGPGYPWLWPPRGICTGSESQTSHCTHFSASKPSVKGNFCQGKPRRFLKKPQPCDGFKHNSKATNTTTVGRACQSARCCCWKNCSAAMGFGLPCHRRERRREQELWAPAPLVQKEKKIEKKGDRRKPTSFQFLTKSCQRLCMQ